MKIMFRTAVFVFTTALVFSAPVLLSVVFNTDFVSNAEASERKTKKVPAMRERVYSQLARAQKVADEEGTDAGLAILDEVKERLEQMNSYERAMLWNFYGFTYYNAERIDEAIQSFDKVVSEEAIPESLMMSTLFSLAQLNMMQDNYSKTLEYLARWKEANPKELNANEHILFAQVYYQTKEFKKALPAINAAIDLMEKDGKTPKENWLVLQRAVFYELKQPKNVTRVLEKMVHLYGKPKYWIQLAGMYGEIGQEDKQMATMESAWQAGFVTKESDLNTLAQLYIYNGIPFKAAKLMEESIESGNIARKLKNLEFLAQAWLLAKEEQKAVPVLSEAGKLSDNGNNYAYLAETLVNMEKWQAAIDASNLALDKGRLKNEGNMHMAQGIAYFNLKEFDLSLAALNKAKSFKKVAKMAIQWQSYVSKEMKNSQQLAMIRN